MFHVYHLFHLINTPHGLPSREQELFYETDALFFLSKKKKRSLRLQGLPHVLLKKKKKRILITLKCLFDIQLNSTYTQK